MSCQNCNKFKSECGAECCYTAPIDKNIYQRNFTSSVRPVIELIELDSTTVLPMTTDGKCLFLKEDLSCNIYNDRPMLCRKFGDESHINLTCAYQKKDGSARGPKDKAKVQKAQSEKLNQFIKK